MALPVRKGYKGAPAQAVLTNSPTISDTSFVVDTVVGWATTFPFYCVVEPGTSREEKVKVTAISGTTLTVSRQQDDTGPQGHNSGSSIYPVFSADEADEANQIASVMTTKGDLISTDGSTINRLGVGTTAHVLQADSAVTNGVKWGQILEAGIADLAVTSAKIANGTIVNEDISTSAAISHSKLANASPAQVLVGAATTGTLTARTLTGDVTIDSLGATAIGSNAIVLGDLAVALQAFLVPIGSINAYGGTTAPAGWLMCDGSAIVSKPLLVAVLGGATTTPDLRGKFPMGKTAAGTGSTLLGAGGSTTISISNMPSHSHLQSSHNHTQTDHSHNNTVTNNTVNTGDDAPDHTHNYTAVGASGTTISSGTGTIVGTTTSGGANQRHVHAVTSNVSISNAAAQANINPATAVNLDTGGGSAYFQPFIAVNYIIKHD